MFSIYDGREAFYQWDIDRKLIVDDASINQVHFCNKTGDCSLVCEVYEQDGLRLVNVPNILLQTTWRINAYGYDSTYTKHSEYFCINARTKPEDYVYTETEVLNYNTLLEKLENIENDIGQTINDFLEENPIEVEVDLTGYATETYVDEAVSKVPQPDLTKYATKDYVDGAIEILEVDYATKDYVDDAIEAITIEPSDGSCLVFVGPDAPTDASKSVWIDTDAMAPEYALKSEIPSLEGYALKEELPVVPTKVSAFTNDAGYLTEHQSLEGYAKTTDIPDVSGFTTMAAVEAKGYQTAEQVNALIDEALGVIENGSY